MQPTARLGPLYGALTPTERARLMARISRDGDRREMARIRESVPDADAPAYNHALRILRQLHSLLAPNLGMIALAADRDALALRALIREAAHERRRRLDLMDVWRLVPYPVTEAEYVAILAREQAQAWPLADCGDFLLETWTAEEAQADGWRPAVVAWLGNDGDGRDGLAFLHDTITAGELPAPRMTEDGPALPRSVLYNWLAPGKAYAPYGPAYHVPVVELLGGALHPQWDVRPDTEAAAVHERREEIAAVLFPLAHLDADDWPAIHPPASAEERAAQAARIEAAWPWRDADSAIRAQAAYVGAQHAVWRDSLAAHLTVLGEIEREVFGGEDPLPPFCRMALETATGQYAQIAQDWEALGDLLTGPRGDDGLPLLGEPWPALPGVSDEDAAASVAAFRAIYGEDD